MALPSQVSQTIHHKPQSCKHCGLSFSESHESLPVEKRQVWEVPEIKPSVIEHVFYRTTCSCGHKDRLDVPEWMYSGTGENLQALIAYLTVEGKLSRRILQSILENVFHLPLALGAIQNRLEDTSRVIQPVCDEIENELTNQPVVSILMKQDTLTISPLPGSGYLSQTPSPCLPSVPLVVLRLYALYWENSLTALSSPTGFPLTSNITKTGHADSCNSAGPTSSVTSRRSPRNLLMVRPNPSPSSCASALAPSSGYGTPTNATPCRVSNSSP